MHFHGLYWLALISAFLLSANFVFINPGGPFISVLHTIIPLLFLLWTFAHVLCGYSRASTPQKVVRIAYAGCSAAMFVSIVMGTYNLFAEPLNRGKLFGP